MRPLSESNVLAVLDDVIQRSGHVVACDVVQARARIAELIAADREYDEAWQAFEDARLSEPKKGYRNWADRFDAAEERLEAARDRRAAALANVDGDA